MSEVQVTTEIKGFARLKIHSGKIQEFKDLQAKCMAIVRAKDTGTLQYEVFWQCMYTFKDKQILDELETSGAAPWCIWKNGKSGAGVPT